VQFSFKSDLIDALCGVECGWHTISAVGMLGLDGSGRPRIRDINSRKTPYYGAHDGTGPSTNWNRNLSTYFLEVTNVFGFICEPAPHSTEMWLGEQEVSTAASYEWGLLQGFFLGMQKISRLLKSGVFFGAVSMLIYWQPNVLELDSAAVVTTVVLA
jgi:hypothetical protein